MMKSIFLSDSSNNNSASPSTTSRPTSSGRATGGNDDDFILVDHVGSPSSFDYDADTNNSLVPDNHEEEESKQDFDDEYDYCDDAICEGIQSGEQGYGCSFTFSLTEDMILEQAEQPSIQHILDEAHRSASELISTKEPRDPMASSPQQQEVPGILESSASDVSVQSTTQTPPSPAPPKPSEKKKKSVAVVPQPRPLPVLAPNGGRMSNKKRRKKMKLLKKAAAAANAVASLSSDVPQSANTTSDTTTTTTDTTSKASKKSSVPSPPSKTTRYQSKRVGSNLAVACATKTLASYNAELKAGTKKVH